jgi:alpha-tubulin suppressor-like RCC1 family protein
MLKTVNKIVSLLCTSFFIVGFTACNKEPVYTPESMSTTSLYDFWLEKTTSNTNLNRPYQGMVMGDTAVHLMVDYGTNITALEPTLFSDADSIAPKGKQNFSNPVKYTLWANGKSASYTVRIIVSTIQLPIVKTIAAGYSHVLVLKNDGTLWACGDNGSSQLGLGDYSSRNRLTQVPVYDVDQVFTGDAASIIKLKDGTTWGAGNQYGQLGLGNKNSVVNFTRVPFLDNATQFAITFGEVIALKADGTVWGAGRNLYRTLAQGDYEQRSNFVKIAIPGVKQISGNGTDIVVQKTNGEVWGWGQNVAGQLGLGDNLPRFTPVLLPTPSISVAKIFAGGSSIFLLDNNGKVWCSGANARGQLGLGDINNRNSFTQLSFFNTRSIDAIIAHGGSTSFKESNGNVWNVGDNVNGLMGVGSVSTLPVLTPVQLSGFSATKLAGYGGTSYALKPDGSLWAWGSNSAGALGTGGDSTYSSSPIQIK